MKTILITGCSSGIGYDAAKTLKLLGWRVFATCRKPADCLRLESEGFDLGSEEYYSEVDKRIREEFPQKFDESSVKSKPQQKVASAGRVAGNPGSNKRQVKLSPSEVQMAKRLNVPLEEYAKYVKR